MHVRPQSKARRRAEWHAQRCGSGQDRTGIGIGIGIGLAVPERYCMRRATSTQWWPAAGGRPTWTSRPHCGRSTACRTGDVEDPPARLLQRTRHKPDAHARHKPQVRQRVHRQRSVCVVRGHARHGVLAVERQVVCRSSVGLELDLAGLRTEGESDLRPPRAAAAPIPPHGPSRDSCHRQSMLSEPSAVGSQRKRGNRSRRETVARCE